MKYATEFKDQDNELVNFNLYQIEDIDFNETKRQILDNLETNHKESISKILEKAGIELIAIDYFSPTYYNYQGDSIDLELEISDPKKLIKFVKKNADKIQIELDKNKSYDGYMALTSDSIDEVIAEINGAKTIDVILLNYILSEYNEISQDFIYDNLVYDDTDDDIE